MAAFIGGLGLSIQDHVEIPPIIRIVQKWADSDFTEETAADLVADAEGFAADSQGFTRVLPRYLDDWWNLPEDVENCPETNWWTRYTKHDYTGVLDYGEQVCPLHPYQFIFGMA